MNLNYLITGANGFVGQALGYEMYRRNISFRTSSRAPISQPGNIGHRNIVNIDEHTDWTDALADIDIVIHLAARVHVMNNKLAGSLADFIEVNLHSTTNLAHQAAEHGIKRFIYISSIKVNGEYSSLGHPLSELDNPHPQDPYGVSKWQAE